MRLYLLSWKVMDKARAHARGAGMLEYALLAALAVIIFLALKGGLLAPIQSMLTNFTNNATSTK
jgi:Flp pilus assembly pilin Flp